MTSSPLSDAALLSLLDTLAGEESFVFLETTRITAENHRSLLFRQPVARLLCTASDSAFDFFNQAEDYLRRGYHLAGWLSYEFGRLLEPAPAERFQTGQGTVLADFGVYGEPHIFDHHTGVFSGAGPWRATSSQGGPAVSPVSRHHRIDNLRLNQAREDYINKIQAIKAYIETGDTYQVNYTLKLGFDFSGSAESLYTTLRRNQSVSYGAYIKSADRTVLSFSPELFFAKRGDTCTVRPMKGTIRRGRTAAEDLELAEFLRQDGKNRSENVMIVDLLRNDLGRLSTMGGVSAVSLFDIETYETLHQMTSTVQGRLRPDLSLTDLFSAVFPCGSVTGAPKIRTMEIIRELELEERGIYTGGIGYITPFGDALFNVPIRTVVLADGRGEMGIGSGIVYDSDPDREWEECRLKGDFLTRPAPDFQLIETLIWLPDDGYWLLEPHLDRLLHSAGFFAFQADRQAIAEQLRTAAARFPAASPQRVRLLLHKDGVVEITAAPCPPPRLTMAEETAAGNHEPPRVVLSAQATDSRSPYLYHKTTLRDLYDRERQKATAAGFYEVLFRNEEGLVTEGGITNIFIRQDKALVTPPVECGLLNGILRRHLLASGAAAEKMLTHKDLETADAIYVGNSVRGLVRVRL